MHQRFLPISEPLHLLQGEKSLPLAKFFLLFIAFLDSHISIIFSLLRLPRIFLPQS